MREVYFNQARVAEDAETVFSNLLLEYEVDDALIQALEPESEVTIEQDTEPGELPIESTDTQEPIETDEATTEKTSTLRTVAGLTTLAVATAVLMGWGNPKPSRRQQEANRAKEAANRAEAAAKQAAEAVKRAQRAKASSSEISRLKREAGKLAGAAKKAQGAAKKAQNTSDVDARNREMELKLRHFARDRHRPTSQRGAEERYDAGLNPFEL